MTIERKNASLLNDQTASSHAYIQSGILAEEKAIHDYPHFRSIAYLDIAMSCLSNDKPPINLSLQKKESIQSSSNAQTS